MWRIADGALEVVDACPVRKVEADGLVKVLFFVDARSTQQLVYRGIFGFIERMPKVAFDGVAMEIEHRAGVDLDNVALTNELVQILARQTAAHMAFARELSRREVVDVAQVKGARHLVERLENLGFGVVRNHGAAPFALRSLGAIVAKGGGAIQIKWLCP